MGISHSENGEFFFRFGGNAIDKTHLGAVGYFSAILSGKRYGSYGDMSTLHGMAD